MKARCAALVLVFAVISCGPLLPLQKQDKLFYVLNDRGKPAEGLKQSNLTLLVRDAEANRFINSNKIIFTDNPSTRSYYQLARWVEPPPGRFTLLLLERLQKSGVFSAVSRLGSSVLGDLQLNVEIIEFYHDTSDTPGKALIKMDATLLKLPQRTTIEQRQFTEATELKHYDAEGAVNAFSKSATKILDQMVPWLASSAEKVELEKSARAAETK